MTKSEARSKEMGNALSSTGQPQHILGHQVTEEHWPAILALSSSENVFRSANPQTMQLLSGFSIEDSAELCLQMRALDRSLNTVFDKRGKWFPGLSEQALASNYFSHVLAVIRSGGGGGGGGSLSGSSSEQHMADLSTQSMASAAAGGAANAASGSDGCQPSHRVDAELLAERAQRLKLEQKVSDLESQLESARTEVVTLRKMTSAPPTAPTTAPGTPKKAETATVVAAAAAVYEEGGAADVNAAHYAVVEISSQFASTVEYVRNLPSDADGNISNEQKLQLYALYKQAVQGDVQDGQPWAVQAIARAKWDAWKTEVRLLPA